MRLPPPVAQRLGEVDRREAPRRRGLRSAKLNAEWPRCPKNSAPPAAISTSARAARSARRLIETAAASASQKPPRLSRYGLVVPVPAARAVLPARRGRFLDPLGAARPRRIVVVRAFRFGSGSRQLSLVLIAEEL